MRYNKLIFNIHDTKIPYEPMGGKGANLIRLRNIGAPVCRGIILTSKAFEIFLSENSLWEKINGKLESDKDQNEKSTEIKGYITSAKLPKRVLSTLHKSLNEMGLGNSSLIVRSSANIEDSYKHSFAGQFETVMDVRPNRLEQAILKVYSSLYGNRVLKYIEDAKISSEKMRMAVVIQEFIKTDFAGVAFTMDPVTGKKDKIIIEYVNGLGEELVSGNVEPASISLEKNDLSLNKYTLPQSLSKAIDNKIISELANMVKEIEKSFGFELDIEWGVKGDKIYIFQARPVTTFGETRKTQVYDTSGYARLVGIGASLGIYKGIVRIVKDKNDLKKLLEGEVMVCMTTYDTYLPEMLKAGAIITQFGGLTSHAGIVAREHNIPCITGVPDVMSILHDGDSVIVDALSNSVYYKGNINQDAIPSEAQEYILERLTPYSISFDKLGNVILQKSNVESHLRSPNTHILLEELSNMILLYSSSNLNLTDSQISQISKLFNKQVVALNTDKFDTYTNLEFVLRVDPQFRRVFEEMKRVVSNSREIDGFAKRVLKIDIEYLDRAEKILNSKKLTINELSTALDEINTSSVYFTLINTCLSTSYGVAYIRREYKKIESIIGLDFEKFLAYVDTKKDRLNLIKSAISRDDVDKTLDNIISVYTVLNKWKFKSDELDEWNRRKELWYKAAKYFKELTGYDVNEFLANMHGSAFELKKFIDSIKEQR